jgi:hypothetical protein
LCAAARSKRQEQKEQRQHVSESPWNGHNEIVVENDSSQKATNRARPLKKNLVTTR